MSKESVIKMLEELIKDTDRQPVSAPVDSVYLFGKKQGIQSAINVIKSANSIDNEQ